jgi:hypothetical protein
VPELVLGKGFWLCTALSRAWLGEVDFEHMFESNAGR